MSTKRRRTGQSSSRSGAAREPPPPPQLQLLDEIEKENAAVLNKLPREVWENIVLLVRGTDRWDVGREELGLFPFALTCRYFRDLRQRVNAPMELKTLLSSYSYIEETSYESPGGVRFCPTINEFYEFITFVSADYLKWLFGETKSTYCREAALAKGISPWTKRPWYDADYGEQCVMELAAIRGDLDLIKWLRSQDPPCEWSKKACTAVAWANRWDLLRNLVSMGCPIDKGGMFGVVALDPDHLPDSWDGKLEILKWLQSEHGCIFGDPEDLESFELYDHVRNVAEAAVKHNDLECLQFVRAQGITWNDIVHGEGLIMGQLTYGRPDEYGNADVCVLAAKMGHLEILEYAVEDGCPWAPEMCLEAAEENKHDHVVQWITHLQSLLFQQPSSSSE